MIPSGSGMVLALFPFRYRDVEELLAERGGFARRSRHRLEVGPALRPRKLERRLRSRLKPTNNSWRVDENLCARLKASGCTCTGLVDSSGATIDFLLSAKRDAAAAERFLAKALGGEKPFGAAGNQYR